jgi:hypothetical protein
MIFLNNHIVRESVAYRFGGIAKRFTHRVLSREKQSGARVFAFELRSNAKTLVAVWF